jgi:hypothetical protein
MFDHDLFDLRTPTTALYIKNVSHVYHCFPEDGLCRPKHVAEVTATEHG